MFFQLYEEVEEKIAQGIVPSPFQHVEGIRSNQETGRQEIFFRQRFSPQFGDRFVPTEFHGARDLPRVPTKPPLPFRR